MLMYEIARFKGGPAAKLHKDLVEESLLAEALGWTQVSVTIDGYDLVLIGIPPAST
jgi:hypothetical protein